MRVSVSSKIIASLAASAAAVALFGTGASARDWNEDVFAFELDRSALASTEGVRSTYRDIEREARWFCRTSEGAESITRRALQRCTTDVVDAAVTASSSAALRAHHDGALMLARLDRQDRMPS